MGSLAGRIPQERWRFTHLLTHSFFQSMFAEHLLCAGSVLGARKIVVDKTAQIPAALNLHSRDLWRQTVSKETENMIFDCESCMGNKTGCLVRFLREGGHCSQRGQGGLLGGGGV